MLRFGRIAEKLLFVVFFGLFHDLLAAIEPVRRYAVAQVGFT